MGRPRGRLRPSSRRSPARRCSPDGALPMTVQRFVNRVRRWFTPARPAPRLRTRPLRLEALEERALLSTAQIVNGQLQILGSPQGDLLKLDRTTDTSMQPEFIVTHGPGGTTPTVQSFPSANVSSIRIDGGGGGDLIIVERIQEILPV